VKAKKKDQPGLWLLKVFEDAGVAVDRLAASLPVETARLVAAQEHIRPDELNSILIECERLTGDQHFGMHLTDRIGISDYGIYGYLLLNARTVGEFCEVADAYYATLYRGGEINFSVRSGKCIFEYRVMVPSRVCGRHDNEWTLSVFVNFIRSKVGAKWVPLKTTFANPRPAHTAELEQMFGDNLAFDRPANSFEFEATLLNFQINDADSHLLDILKVQADNLMQNLSEDACFESRVRLLIMNELKHGSPKAHSVAAHLGMSLSTLKRRLKQTNCTFTALRDDVIKNLSQKALAETDLNIGLIAQQMGYSEPSAFNHAFLRLCGITPREYRQRIA
jgi:AraC-like DNA-binding protein